MIHINLPNPFPGFPNFQPNVQAIKANQENKKYRKAFKPGKNGTHIRFILDESSSMGSVYDKTLQGFNAYLSEQKKHPTKCDFTLSKFNGSRTPTVIKNRDIKAVEELTTQTYQPSGSTNLYDAIGMAITEIDEFLSGLKKKERPAILLTIMTDGEENCSTKFSREDIKEMISTREKLGWIFIYLGANQDAWAVGSSFGMNAVNTMSYDVGSIDKTMVSLSASTTTYRAAMASGQSAESYGAKGFFNDPKEGGK